MFAYKSNLFSERRCFLAVEYGLKPASSARGREVFCTAVCAGAHTARPCDSPSRIRTRIQVLKGVVRLENEIIFKKGGQPMSTIIKHKEFPKFKSWTMDCAAVP